MMVSKSWDQRVATTFCQVGFSTGAKTVLAGQGGGRWPKKQEAKRREIKEKIVKQKTIDNKISSIKQL